MYTNTGSHSFCKRQSEENTHSMFEGQQLIEDTSKWPDITAWKFWNWLKNRINICNNHHFMNSQIDTGNTSTVPFDYSFREIQAHLLLL